MKDFDGTLREMSETPVPCENPSACAASRNRFRLHEAASSFDYFTTTARRREENGEETWRR
jgi:hypothetical protein